MGECIITSRNMIEIHKNINRDTKLYHIFSENTFDKILSAQSLRYRKITEWKDPWELPFRMINEIEENDSYIEFAAGDRNRILINECAGMCFTNKFDKEAMWYYYTEGAPGVCIETTAEKLMDTLKKDKIDAAFLGPVIYLNLNKNSVENILVNSKGIDYPSYLYMGYIKRDNYNYEEEVRLILDFGETINTPYMDLSTNVNELVNKIYLSPGLETADYERMIKKYNRLKVPIERSKLYDCVDLKIPKLTNDQIKVVNSCGGTARNSDLIYYKTNDMVWNKI